MWGMFRPDFVTIDKITLTVNTCKSRMIKILKPISKLLLQFNLVLLIY